MDINDFMKSQQLGITYIGGPTCFLEFGGIRPLTDPTFDPAGGEYKSPSSTLHKLVGPALAPEVIGTFDCVLLSHDHHFDNLDHAGRRILVKAKTVVTTIAGAARLRGNSRGLSDWQAIDLAAPNGRLLCIVATPARHGPEGLDRGPVIGFILYFKDGPEHVIYVSGDTVWYEGVAEVARRFLVRVAILHLGAARVANGPYLTMTAKEALEASRTFSNALVIPMHFEDWAHFSEGHEEIASVFASAELTQRIRWPERGRMIQVDL